MKIYRKAGFGLKYSIKATLSNLLYHANEYLNGILKSPIVNSYQPSQIIEALTDRDFLYGQIVKRQEPHKKPYSSQGAKILQAELDKIPSLQQSIPFLNQGGWYYFGINNPKHPQKFKTYVTIQNPYDFKFENFHNSLMQLMATKISCNVKIHDEAKSLLQRIDSVVIHSNVPDNMEAARRIFLSGVGGLGSTMTYSTYGVDDDSSFNDIVCKTIANGLISLKNLSTIQQVSEQLNVLMGDGGQIEQSLLQYYDQYIT